MNVSSSVRPALCLLASTLLLTACGQDLKRAPEVVVQVEYRRQEIPDALLFCDLEPVVPMYRTDENVANYITELGAAGRDCRAKLGAVGQLIVRPAPVVDAGKR